MSTRNPLRETKRPTEWIAVKDTVAFWQNSLVRLNLGRLHQERLDYAARALQQVSHFHDMSPPQTFGELCLEIGSERVGWPTTAIDYECPLHNRKLLGDIQALKTALYRKRTDIEQEKVDQLYDFLCESDLWPNYGR